MTGVMNDIQKVIGLLKKGGVGIFPTDTAFGIGCRIDNADSVQRLFDIRNRPYEKAVPVLISGIEMAEECVCEISQAVRDLITQYWPGGLTIILKCRTEKVPKLVRGGGNTIGIRMPNNETSLDLIRGVGVPILGPSANFAGEKTPYSFQELDPKLTKIVDFVLNGECRIKMASTVLDCTVSSWKIVREGAVKLQSPLPLGED